MIEARVPHTLEGPNDSITFNDGGPWILTEKPRTTVDDRREVYDYPLDDGALVGDAYAGARMWALKGRLRATSHEERNTELQRMQALLNSLRRADGLWKWEPTGFPAVQSTVRRMGSLDYSGGANLHVPIAFNLIAGDPRVYSQTEHTDSAGASTISYGSNLLTTNQSGLETNTAGWEAANAHNAITRSTTIAQAGSASLRLERAASTPSYLSARTSGTIAVTAGDLLAVDAYFRSAFAGNSYIGFQFLDASDQPVSGPLLEQATAADTWTQNATTVVVPTGATKCWVIVAYGKTPLAAFAASQYVYVDTIRLRVATYSAALDVTNDGDADTNPVLRILGPSTGPLLSNTTNSQDLDLDVDLGSSDELIVDSRAREIYIAPTLTIASNRYGSKPATDPFLTMPPGTSSFTLAGPGADGSTDLEVAWRDAWMP